MIPIVYKGRAYKKKRMTCTHTNTLSFKQFVKVNGVAIWMLSDEDYLWFWDKYFCAVKMLDRSS